MPCLNLTGGEPWAETLGVMLFPDHELKRRAVIATLWAGFYPKYEEAGFEPLPRSVLLSIMQASTAARVEKAEMDRGWYHARIAGEQLKVLAAIAAVDPRRASWKMATRIVAHHGQQPGAT